MLAPAGWGTAVVWREGMGLREEAAGSAGEARRTTGIPAVRQRDIRMNWVWCPESILKDMLNSQIVHRPIRNPASPVPLAVNYLHYHTYQNFISEKEPMVGNTHRTQTTDLAVWTFLLLSRQDWESPVTTSGTTPTMLIQRDPRNVKWNNHFLFSLFRQVNLGLHCIPFMLCD